MCNIYSPVTRCTKCTVRLPDVQNVPSVYKMCKMYSPVSDVQVGQSGYKMCNIYSPVTRCTQQSGYKMCKMSGYNPAPGGKRYFKEDKRTLSADILHCLVSARALQ